MNCPRSDCAEHRSRVLELEALLEAERAQLRRVKERLAVLTGNVAVVLDTLNAELARLRKLQLDAEAAKAATPVTPRDWTAEQHLAKVRELEDE